MIFILGCFACCTTSGIRVYNSDPLRQKLKLEFEQPGTLRCTEMLFRSNFLAFVGGGEMPLYPTNHLVIWDDVKKTISTTLDLNSSILAVKLRRDRIVVVSEGVIKVFTFTQIPQQIHVFETNSNLKGLCALSPSSTNSLIAFPTRIVGQVQIVDLADADKPAMDIAAHESELAYITINTQGTYIATASEKGTIIRVFNTATGKKVVEFRRGAQSVSFFI